MSLRAGLFNTRYFQKLSGFAIRIFSIFFSHLYFIYS